LPRAIPASLLALLFACCLGALWSVSARAQSGGGLGYGTTDATPAHGDGGTLLVRTAVILGRTLHIKGTMVHGEAGREVVVQRQEKGGEWVPTATTTTTEGGAFDAAWTTDHIGRFPLRAFPAPTAGASAAAAPATGETPVTVYRQSVATFFGPGFFGKRTACGQTLRKATLGVAHRKLRCGTLVDLYHKGRSVTVPVIDRGPFRKGTTWDLTAATADLLRFTGTGRIGALRLPAAATPVVAGAGR
jgi:rare lipoprotein A